MPDARPTTDTHRVEDAERLVERVMDKHVLTDRPSKTWRFGRPGSTTYAFWMTWTPGTLTIDGDIGSLTLTQYHAIGKDVRKALEWLVTSDSQYLLGKSEVKLEYDVEESAKAVIAYLNEKDIGALRQFHDEMREWRKAGQSLAPDSEYEDRDEWMFWKPRRGLRGLYDGWKSASRILNLSQPGAIIGTTQRAWREEVADSIQDEAEMGPSVFAEFQHQLGIDEPYIVNVYPQQSWLQVAAMQKAARAIIAQMEPTVEDVVAAISAEQGACP